jgi:hypothetical protein
VRATVAMTPPRPPPQASSAAAAAGGDNSHQEDMIPIIQEAIRTTIVDLKQLAIQSKQSNAIPQALSFLKEAKKLEGYIHNNNKEEDDTATQIEQQKQQQQLVKDVLSVLDATVDNNNNNNDNDDDDDDDVNDQPSPLGGVHQLPIQFWKRLAILSKQNHRIEYAKSSLRRAKQLESVTTTTTTTTSEQPTATRTTTTTTTTITATSQKTGNDDHSGDVLDDIEDSGYEDDAMDDGTIDNDDDGTGTVTFTDEEMIDQEMMVEVCAGGMDIPSEDDYATRIVTYKKRALSYKHQHDSSGGGRNGSTVLLTQATQCLRLAKQLQHVQDALRPLRSTSAAGGGGGGGAVGMDDTDQWMSSLNAEESELLGELFREQHHEDALDENVLDGASSDTILPSDTAQVLTCDEIELMDMDDILDFIQMMGKATVPTDLNDLAMIHQENAIQAKQKGDIGTAKKLLIESKRYKVQAQKVLAAMDKIEKKKEGTQDGVTDGVTVDTLEALVGTGGANTSIKKKADSTPQLQTHPPKRDPWYSRPSNEIKHEVFRLKNEKNVKEATRLLQIYKDVVRQEQQIAEAQRCADLVSSLQERIEDCTIQIRLWQYYQWFVPATIDDDGSSNTPMIDGTKQYESWNVFRDQCQQSIRAIGQTGSSAVNLIPHQESSPRQLYTLKDDVNELVQMGMSSLNGDLEVAVMGIYDIHENEKIQKIFRQKQKDASTTTTGTSSSKNNPYCPFLRVEAKVPLPLNIDDPSQPTILHYMPIQSERKDVISPSPSPSSTAFSSASLFQYKFDPTDTAYSRHRVPLPRGESKHAKTILKRLESKSIQLCVYETQLRPTVSTTRSSSNKRVATKSSWFFGGSNNNNNNHNKTTSPTDSEHMTTATTTTTTGTNSKDVLLGKVMIELKPFVSTTTTTNNNCIVGDYPLLLLTSGTKPLGGTVRVCIRTDVPFHVEFCNEHQQQTTPSSSIPITKYKNGWTFEFPNVIGDDHTIAVVTAAAAAAAQASSTT